MLNSHQSYPFSFSSITILKKSNCSIEMLQCDKMILKINPHDLISQMISHVMTSIWRHLAGRRLDLSAFPSVQNAVAFWLEAIEPLEKRNECFVGVLSLWLPHFVPSLEANVQIIWILVGVIYNSDRLKLIIWNNFDCETKTIVWVLCEKSLSNVSYAMNETWIRFEYFSWLSTTSGSLI